MVVSTSAEIPVSGWLAMAGRKQLKKKCSTPASTGSLSPSPLFSMLWNQFQTLLCPVLVYLSKKNIPSLVVGYEYCMRVPHSLTGLSRTGCWRVLFFFVIHKLPFSVWLLFLCAELLKTIIAVQLLCWSHRVDVLKRTFRFSFFNPLSSPCTVNCYLKLWHLDEFNEFPHDNCASRSHPIFIAYSFCFTVWSVRTHCL